MTACRFLVCIAALLASETTLAQPCRPGAAGNIDVSNVSQMTLCLALPTGQTGAHSGAPILFLNTFDGHTIALDSTTGNVLWDVLTTAVDRGETLLAAPLVAGDRVFIGNNGSDFGVRGWMAALDAASGQILWKRYNTGPDSDVGIGEGFASAYLPHDPDAGVASWPSATWQQGGGGLAETPIYDQALGLLIPRRGHWRGTLVRADQSARSIRAWSGGVADCGRAAQARHR